MKQSRPEILAPVGNWAMFEAALAAGADVIYAASKSFGARAYASNFSNEELEKLIHRAHWNGIKVYITFNTLVKEDELDEAIDQIDALVAMRCDALIVQDMGIIRLLQDRHPDLPIHGSTQLSVTSLEGARYLEKLGLSRIVLGREVTIEEATRIKASTKLEVEAFVHGSLCVSVSGQCLMSSFAGGRSGNRGRCAQPCRKTYELKDGQGKLIAKDNTYISPRDLQTISFIDRYHEIGLDCFKIEGRMKKPEYVYSAVTSYRQALDKENVDLLALQLVSNRPFTKGLSFHDFGVDYAFKEDEKSGKIIGQVVKHGRGFALPLEEEIVKGDIIHIKSKKHYFPLTATEDHNSGSRWDLSAYTDLIEGEHAYLIYRQRTRDKLEEVQDAGLALKREVSIDASFIVGEKLRLTASSEGVMARIEADEVQAARTQPLSKDRIEESLGQLGDSPFLLEELKLHVQGEGFLPISKIKQARRNLLMGLENKILEQNFPPYPEANTSVASQIKQQSENWNEWSPQEVKIDFDTYDFPDIFGEAIANLSMVIVHREEQIKPWVEQGIPVIFAGPRLLEADGYKKLESLILRNKEALSGYLVQSLNDLGFYQHLINNGILDKESVRLMGGHELNITNHMAIEWLKDAGMSHYVPSPELKIGDSLAMRQVSPTEPASHLLAYGRLSGMLMKHCPAAMVKGCIDDSQCPTCQFRKNIFLVDEYGSREVYRQHGYSELLLPTTIDLRYDSGLVKQAKPAYLHLVHRGEGEIVETLRYWTNWISNGGKFKDLPMDKRRKKAKLGNYIDGIE